MAFRNGDFSARADDHLRPADRQRRRHGPDAVSGQRHSRQSRSARSRERFSRICPSPISRRALGQINYQAPYVREKTTDSFDVKINHQITQQAIRSRGDSATSGPRSSIRRIFGLLRRRRQGLLRHRHQHDHTAPASTTTRVWTQHAGAWRCAAASATTTTRRSPPAPGRRRREEVGIRGANIDEWTSGMTQHRHRRLQRTPLVGFAASLPWDRSERTLQFATVFTKIAGNHTIKFGEDLRHNRDFLLQMQDNGGPRGRFQFRGPQTAIPTDAAAQNGFANAFASFLLDVPAGVGRDLKVVDPGTRHWAFFTLHPGQVAGHAEADDRPRPAPRVLHAARRPRRARAGSSNYDPATNTLRVAGYGDVPANLGVKKYFEELRAAHRRVVPARRDRRSCAPATASARCRSRTTATRSTSR